MSARLLSLQRNFLNMLGSNAIPNDFHSWDIWWLENVGWGVADVPFYEWGAFNAATECTNQNTLCQPYGAKIRSDAAELFQNMQHIGIITNVAAATYFGMALVPWPIPPTVPDLWPNVPTYVAPGQPGYDPKLPSNRRELFACFDPARSSPYSTPHAWVCWVCADLYTQLLLHSANYDLHAVMARDTVFSDYFNNIPERNTVAIAQYYRDHDALISGGPNGVYQYSVGDAVILSNDVATHLRRKKVPETKDFYAYHMGIIVKGGTNLDEILVAQLSYGSEGYFKSGGTQLPDYPLSSLGRFQVITLRTYILRHATAAINTYGVNAHLTIPASMGDAAGFNDIMNKGILHGMPQTLIDH